MVRRTRNNASELVDLVAFMPWWVGIALAVISYFILHAVASSPIPPATQPGSASNVAIGAVLRGLATAGQYALPIICLAGALVSAVRRSKRQRLARDAVVGEATRMVDGMTWREFEMLVGEAFRLQGYRVEETGRGGADGGVDLALTKAGEKFMVQCKQWRAFSVGVDVVRELYGVMAARGSAGGFVVTSGRFTKPAVEFADGRNIQLVDAAKLHALLQRARSSLSAEALPHSADAATSTAPIGMISPPECAECGKPMIRRTARRGNKAGNDFWGCTGYPKCRSTRPI
jgi:restriction system protein